MAQIPLQKKASYPSKEWREAPPIPFRPRRGPRPLTVGNGNNVVAHAPTGSISSATGSFESVTGVTGVTTGTVANCYTLQVNTNLLNDTSHLPPGFPGAVAGCQAWQQFLFVQPYAPTNSALVFIQYWLLGYGNTSPPNVPGQLNWANDGSTHTNGAANWRKNSTNSSNPPIEPIANLANLKLTGNLSASGDSYSFSDGGTTPYTEAGDNPFGQMAGAWNQAEFAVVGNPNAAGAGGVLQATFNSNSAIVTRTEIIYGGTAAPQCQVGGFTLETNNLSFDPTIPPASQPGPALLVTESSTGNEPTSSYCSNATTVGDTHLTTFNGLLYDFQASGEFVLAEVDPDFVVQTRQVSGAPTWPNASVNSAVATRMGKTMVAVCLDRLAIDDNTTDLGDGKSIFTPDGVDITRRGNVYFITSPSGYSVRATVNSSTTPQSTSWIDVLVGLGNCSAEVKGLIANANGNVNQIAARDGTVLTNPFNFDQLYHQFADSWRVPPEESLLDTCGEQVKIGIPQKPFYASDLPQQVYDRALAVSRAAGVEQGALLDAATLDVGVIGDDRAAQVFVGARPPVAVGKFR